MSVECRLRHLRERLVGRGKHCERARAFERVDETRGPEERGERLDAAVVTAIVTMSAVPAVERAEADGAGTAATATTAVARMSVIVRIGLSFFVLTNDRFLSS